MTRGRLPTRLVCSGCGTTLLPKGLPPFSCPAVKPGDDVDHVLRRYLDTQAVPFPRSEEQKPFLAFRTLFHAYHLARAAGLSDEAYVSLVNELDARVAEVDGRGFRVTPAAMEPALAEAVGWRGELGVKDETGNVAGSHKARHLFGVLLYLEALRRAGAADEAGPLAISSCGNAALGAAVVAKAARRPLEVFVPTWAEEKVLERLRALEATVVACARGPGEKGDPCTARFRRRVREGAIPFSCQGPDNGLVIEGGMTLGYELLAAGLTPQQVFVQVGGGALGSALAQAFQEAVRWGLWPRLPALMAVQTEGAAPLRRAYVRVLRKVLGGLGYRGHLPVIERDPSLDELSTWAGWVREQKEVEVVVRVELERAAQHRSLFMWPWEKTPRSAAHGILDDETYDWVGLVEGMLLSGGFPVVVPENTVLEAHALARKHTAVPVDATGTAGLAGLLHLVRSGLDAQASALVLFTGRDRRA